MLGIFLGFAAALLAAGLDGRWRRSELPSPAATALLGALFGLLVVDGANALLASSAWSGWYPPSNPLRFVSGLGGGLALSSFAVPVTAERLWARPDRRPFYTGLRELLAPVGLALALGGLVSLGLGGWLVVSTLAFWAVVFSLSFANLHLWRLFLFPPAPVSSPNQLASPLAAALALTGLELAAFAQLRTWVGT